MLLVAHQSLGTHDKLKQCEYIEEVALAIQSKENDIFPIQAHLLDISQQRKQCQDVRVLCLSHQ